MAKRPLKKRLKYTLIYWFTLSLIRTTNSLPRKWVLNITEFLGGIAFHFLKEQRDITIRNLTYVYGEARSDQEIKELASKVFKMIGKNAGDIIRGLPIRDLEKLKGFVKIEGEEHLRAACARGNGVVVVTGHLGAFEYVGSFLGLSGYDPLVIGTALKDEKLNELLVFNRTSRGIVAIERGKETIKLLRTLKAGGMMVLLIDQDTKVKSRFVNFLGKPAATPIGGTLMAQRTGAAVVPMYISMQPDCTQLITIYPEVPMRCTGDEELDLIHNTQRISDTTEKAILENPEQWVWMHERWKTKPGEEIR